MNNKNNCRNIGVHQEKLASNMNKARVWTQDISSKLLPKRNFISSDSFCDNQDINKVNIWIKCVPWRRNSERNWNQCLLSSSGPLWNDEEDLSIYLTVY